MSKRRPSRPFVECQCTACGIIGIWVEECRRGDGTVITPVVCPACQAEDTIEERQ